MFEIAFLILLYIITLHLTIPDVNHILDKHLDVLIMFTMVKFWNDCIDLFANDFLLLKSKYGCK